MRAPDPVQVIHANRRAADGRRFRYAVALSALLHFVALILIHFHVPTPEEIPPPPPRLVRITPEMQAFDLDVVAIEAPAIEVQLRRPDEPPPVAAPTISAPVAPAGPAAAAPTLKGDPSLDRLRYRNSEKDVWRRSDPERMTDDEAVRQRVAAQIDAYNDSVAAEAGARERALDWTVKDADGKRWGVSPGAIHLGGVTVPIPFAFGTSPEKREEVAGRVATWGAIQQQATIVEGREIIKDRVKAIEQRKAAERAARQGTTGGSTTGGGS